MANATRQPLSTRATGRGVVAQALLAPHLARHQAAGQVFFFVAVALAVVFGATAVVDAKGAAVGV